MHSHDEITAVGSGTWLLGDREVRRMGFGTMRLTADPDPAAAIQVLRLAVEMGINHFDTAAFYVSPGGTLRVGSGEPRFATELIRAALHPYGDDLVVTTKVGFTSDDDGPTYPAATPEQLRAQVDENLRRLGRDHLDVVNLRLPRQAPADAAGEAFGFLAGLRESGLIRHLGISNVRKEHLLDAMSIAPVVCVQNQYALDGREDDELVAYCGEQGIAFVPFFALAGERREAGATDDHSAAVQQVALAHGVTPHQVRLAWTLHRGPHVLAIPGTADPGHLRQNVAAGQLVLSPAELASLD